LSVYRTLSVRYLRQRWTRASLIVASIALGVATLVATASLNETMNKAVRVAANPLAGGADLMVSKGGETLIDVRPTELTGRMGLTSQLSKLPGVDSVRPLLFQNVTLPDLKGDKERTVLMVGVDRSIIQSAKGNPWGITFVPWYTWSAWLGGATG